MRAHINELNEGALVAEDVFSTNGLLLVRRGTSLKKADLQRLHQHHVDYVNIYNMTMTQEIAVPFEEVSLETKERFNEAVIGIKQCFDIASKEKHLNKLAVDQAFIPLIKRFDVEKNMVSLLLSLNSKDEYTYQHSVQVGIISFFLATWMGLTEEECIVIAKAGYLHDIGKCEIDDAILKKPAKLTAQEYEEIKRHPLIGYELARNSFDDSRILSAILEHHERIDGGGYPFGKQKDEISLAAKIVAVADIYSAMICNRIYQSKRNLLLVLKELFKMSFGELDAVATHTFICNMLPQFIGKKVVLHNGMEGTIIMNNPTDYFKPLIQLKSEYINLLEHPDLEITNVML